MNSTVLCLLLWLVKKLKGEIYEQYKQKRIFTFWRGCYYWGFIGYYSMSCGNKNSLGCGQKFGILIKDRTVGELNFFLSNAQDYFSKNLLDQLYIFAENIVAPGPRFPYPFMNMSESWEFDGILMTFQPDLAYKATKFASPKKTLWLLPGRFWEQQQFPAKQLFSLLTLYNNNIVCLQDGLESNLKSLFNVNCTTITNKNIFEAVNEEN